MDFAIQCDCGEILNVAASQAGTAVTCACGKQARVPPLGVLRSSAGLPSRPPSEAARDWLPDRSPFVCQACGVEAATRQVALHCNIGALFIRFPSYLRGRLCKWCIRDYFWRYTGTTAIGGWWGMISFVMTPFIIVNNIGQYARTFGMEPVADGAQAPELTPEVINRIRPLAESAIDRIDNGLDAVAVMRSVASVASVTPGQVYLYLQSGIT